MLVFELPIESGTKFSTDSWIQKQDWSYSDECLTSNKKNLSCHVMLYEQNNHDLHVQMYSSSVLSSIIIQCSDNTPWVNATRLLDSSYWTIVLIIRKILLLNKLYYKSRLSWRIKIDISCIWWSMILQKTQQLVLVAANFRLYKNKSYVLVVII